MPDATPTTASGPVLVSDFDGTMTRHDFYKLAIEKLLPADTPDHWADYRSGAITHFEALRRYFAAICKSEDEVLAVVRQMERLRRWQREARLDGAFDENFPRSQLWLADWEQYEGETLHRRAQDLIRQLDPLIDA